MKGDRFHALVLSRVALEDWGHLVGKRKGDSAGAGAGVGVGVGAGIEHAIVGAQANPIVDTSAIATTTRSSPLHAFHPASSDVDEHKPRMYRRNLAIVRGLSGRNERREVGGGDNSSKVRCGSERDVGVGEVTYGRSDDL